MSILHELKSKGMENVKVRNGTYSNRFKTYKDIHNYIISGEALQEKLEGNRKRY